MRQTLFYIPHEVGPFPLYGVTGIASTLWALAAIAVVAWLARRKGGLGREVQSYIPVFAIVWLALAFLAPILTIDGYGIPIRGYGVMMLIGVIAGVALAVYRARQMGVDPELIFTLAFVLFIPALIGARAFYVIQYSEEFKSVGAIINLTKGGLVVYGSLVGGLIGGAIFLCYYKLPVLAIGDLIAPSLLVGLAIGRIGCLMNGCCFGGACDLPWAMTFPFQSPPYPNDPEIPWLHLRDVEIEEDGQLKTIVVISYIDPRGVAHGHGLQVDNEITHIDGREVKSAKYGNEILKFPRSELTIEQRGSPAVTLKLPRTRPIHPTQVYSAINATLLAAFLWVAYPFRGRDGVIIALLLTLYPFTRLLLEWVRKDEEGRFGTELTISQWVSLGVIIMAVALWLYIFRRQGEQALPGDKPLTLSVPAQS